MNLLQARIEELNSVILNFQGNIVHVDGFYNCGRLHDYLSGKDCWQSKGLYDFEELDYSRLKDNCLVIIMKEGMEIKRYQYKPIFKGIVKYKNLEKKNVSRIFSIRKCAYSHQFNIHIFDDDNNKQSLVYDNMQDLKLNLLRIFPGYKLYGLDNKRINEDLNSLWGDDSLFQI